MRARFTVIDFPVFSNYFIHVEITSDIEKSLAKYPCLKYVDAEEIIGSDGLTASPADHNMSFIFLPPNPGIGTVVHECWHAIHRMMDFMGVDLDNETVAYHLGYLVDNVSRFIRKRK